VPQKSSGDAATLRWDSDAPNRLTVGDTTFNVADLFPARNDQRMVVRKPPDMIEVVAAVINEVKPRNIIELGIAQGGSTALLAQLAQPAKLVAIEKELAAVAALESYISSHDLESVVKPYYGVDQADTVALDRIVASEFGDEPLDLVIDDASHLLNETRISFNRLFPHVREGGVYMIEDWAWGHYSADTIPPELVDNWSASWPTGAPLTVLAFELLMTCAAPDRIIQELKVDREFVQIRRGPATLDRSTFDISHSFIEGPVKLLAPRIFTSSRLRTRFS